MNTSSSSGSRSGVLPRDLNPSLPMPGHLLLVVAVIRAAVLQMTLSPPYLQDYVLPPLLLPPLPPLLLLLSRRLQLVPTLILRVYGLATTAGQITSMWMEEMKMGQWRACWQRYRQGQRHLVLQPLTPKLVLPH
jgi:hypothetical protein